MDFGKTAVFIEGMAIYSQSRFIEKDIDYKKLLDWLNKNTDLLRASYYVAILDTEDYTPLKPLCDWLGYNGYNLVTKTARAFTNAGGHQNIKGDVKVEITTDMIGISSKVDDIILFSGDNDYSYAIEAAKRNGARITVISNLEHVGDNIRRNADHFIELKSIVNQFCREKRNEPVKTDPIRM